MLMYDFYKSMISFKFEKTSQMEEFLKSKSCDCFFVSKKDLLDFLNGKRIKVNLIDKSKFELEDNEDLTNEKYEEELSKIKQNLERDTFYFSSYENDIHEVFNEYYKKDNLYFCIAVLKTHHYELINTNPYVGLAHVKVRLVHDSENYYMTLKSPDVIYDKQFIHIFKVRLGEDLTYETNNFNYDDYINFVNQFVEKGYFSLQDEFCITDCDLDYMNFSYTLFKHKVDMVEDSLDQIIDNQVNIQNYNKQFYNSNKKKVYSLTNLDIVSDILENYKTFRFSLDNENVEKSFERSFLRYLVSSKKNALIITKDNKQKKKVQNVLDANGFAGFYPRHNFNEVNTNLRDEFLDSYNINETTIYTDAEKDMIAEYSRLRTYHSPLDEKFINKVETVFGEAFHVTLNKAAYFLNNAEHLIDTKFDINKYSIDDYVKDQVFFSKLDTYSSFNCISLKENLCYGLSFDKERLSYKETIQVTENVKQAIVNLLNYFKELNVRSWRIGLFDSLTDIFETENNLYELNKYSGFDVKYFNYAKDSEIRTTFNNLVELNEDFLDAKKEISKYFNDPNFVYSKSISSFYLSIVNNDEDKKANKKIIKQNLVKKSDYRSFMKDMEQFVIKEKNFYDRLAEVESIFGIEVYSADGINKIRKNFDYIDEVETYFHLRETSANISFNSDFVKKYYNDVEYRQNLLDVVFPTMDKMIEALKSALTSYREIHKEDDTNYEAMSFKKLLNLFSLRASMTKQQLEEYALYIDSLKKTSDNLKTFIKIFNDKGYSFSSCKNDYFASLYNNIYLSYLDETINDSDEKLENKISLIYFLLKNNPLLVKKTIMDANKERSEFLKSDFFKERISALNHTYSFNSLPSTKAILNAVSNVYNIVYPVSVFSVEEIEVYSNIHFDYLIIYDSLDFTDAELAYFISMYPNVIFVKHSVEDLRLKDIPLIKFDINKILNGIFDYTRVTSYLREYLIKVLAQHNISVEPSDPEDFSEPLIATYDGVKYPLVLDILFNRQHDDTTRVSLYNLIIKDYGLFPIEIDTFKLIFDRNNEVGALIKSIQTFKDRIHYYGINDVDAISRKISNYFKNGNRLYSNRYYLYGSKEEFENRLNAFIESLPSYPKDEDIIDVINSGDFYKFCNLCIPIREDHLAKLVNTDFQLLITMNLEAKNLVQKDGFICFNRIVSNSLKNNKVVLRKVEEISVYEVAAGVFELLSNFDYLTRPMILEAISKSYEIYTHEDIEALVDKALNVLIEYDMIGSYFDKYFLI